MVECQLPKLDVAGSTPVSRSIFSITWESSATSSTPFHSVKPLRSGFPHVFRLCLGRLRLFPGQNRLLQHLRSPPPCFNAGLRVDIERHADAMPALVSRYLRIDLGFMAETGMRSPEHLKIRPAKPDRLPAWASCSVPDVIPPHGLCGFSEANTHASGCLPTSSIHSRSSLAVCEGMPTVLLDDVVLDRRCRRGKDAARWPARRNPPRCACVAGPVSRRAACRRNSARWSITRSRRGERVDMLLGLLSVHDAR